MDYVVGYRGFRIIRKSGDAFFQVYRGDTLASPGKFYSFTAAREECEAL